MRLARDFGIAGLSVYVAMSDTLLSVLPWYDVPYDEQLARKQRFVEVALQNRKLEAEVLPVHPSPRMRGARSRVKIRGQNGRLGFHRPGSHDFVEVPLGEVAIPPVAEMAERLLSSGGIPDGGEAEIRSDGNRTVLVLSRAVDPRAPGVAGLPAVAQQNRALWGEVRLEVNGLLISPLSFYQVNLDVNLQIVGDLDARLQALLPSRLLDLYSGVGNLSMRAIRRGTPATLVEREGSSVMDARRNFGILGKPVPPVRPARPPPIEVREEDAGRFQAGSTFFDVALIDPPRAGAPGVLPKLAMTRPRAIFYLSCDPTSLARDLSELKHYRIRSVQPYDMFPSTEHVEVLVELERAPTRPPDPVPRTTGAW